MTALNGFSKKQDRDGAAKNQQCLGSRPETACRSSLDTCYWWRAIVVCRNFLWAKQRLVDLWQLTHRHDNVLQLHLFWILLPSNAVAIQAQ